jgi:hypothetical protein
MGRKAQSATIQGRGAEMRVIYPDARIEPKSCNSTHMKRAFCPCRPCRNLRRKKHRAHCQCWLCYAGRMGAFIDTLGKRTTAGRWLWFLTLTFRTPDYPWARKFPIQQSKPFPDFVNHFFQRMVSWIEGQVHGRVEYFFAHQFGETGRRLHLHCGLSWPGLFEYRWKDLQEMLWKDAGFNRILPWEQDAGFYIGRYVGRDADRAHWDFRVGLDPVQKPVSVGRQVVAVSSAPDDSSREYRRTLRAWHR